MVYMPSTPSTPSTMPMNIPRTRSATQIPTQVSSTGLALPICPTEHLVSCHSALCSNRIRQGMSLHPSTSPSAPLLLPPPPTAALRCRPPLPLPSPHPHHQERLSGNVAKEDATSCGPERLGDPRRHGWCATSWPGDSSHSRSEHRNGDAAYSSCVT